MLRRSYQRRGFTLIEIIVVSTLIALLSGIALFSINEMYIRNIRKVSFAEAYQLATALSIAENDLDFYPNFNNLKLPKDLVLVEPNTPTDESIFNASTTPTATIPGLDYWGFFRHDSPATLRIISNWNGPYMGVSQARQDSNRGAQSGIVRMRLPHLAAAGGAVDAPALVSGRDISIVDWPADPFGNPYLLYQLKTHIDDSAGANIPFFIESAEEDANFKNMIVSYGRNNFPGGDDNTSRAFGESVLLPGALYVEGDNFPEVDGEKADFTLRIMDRRALSTSGLTSTQIANNTAIMAAIEALDPNLLLSNDVTDVLAADTTDSHYQVLRALSLDSADPSNFDPATGQVGVIDTGSDDIILEF